MGMFVVCTSYRVIDISSPLLTYHYQFSLSYSIRLLRHNQAVEDLLKFEDLTLLFSAISFPCSSHNKIWRKASAEALMTVCKHNLTGK